MIYGYSKNLIVNEKMILIGLKACVVFCSMVEMYEGKKVNVRF